MNKVLFLLLLLLLLLLLVPQEGTTQGDPLAMPWYAINTVHMITSLRASIPQVKQVWLADDSAGGGSIESLYQWYKSLCEEGRKFGYIVNGAKSWLIVKTSELAESAKKVFGDEVNITLEGRRHLGAVIGSKEFKSECTEKSREIGKSWPQLLTYPHF